MMMFLTVFGIVYTVYAVILCIISNYNAGIILNILLGVFILVSGIFYEEIILFCSSGIGLALSVIILAGILFEIILITFLEIYGGRDNPDYKEKAVIVPGAGIEGEKLTLTLRLRLDKAIEYLKKNPSAYIVVSGGQGMQESVTEGYAMEKYLLSKGILKSEILKEEKATSTNENMRFSKKILDEILNEDYGVVVVTNKFHIYRAVSIAHKEGFRKVSHIHSGLQWYNIIPCYLRETLAVVKLQLLK